MREIDSLESKNLIPLFQWGFNSLLSHQFTKLANTSVVWNQMQVLIH